MKIQDVFINHHREDDSCNQRFLTDKEVCSLLHILYVGFRNPEADLEMIEASFETLFTNFGGDL